MAIFNDYSADDKNVVSAVQKLHGQIDVASLNLENRSKKLDSMQLSLLIPYLDSINVLIHRANCFINEIKDK